MKLLLLLLLPIYSFAGTNKIEFDAQRSSTIYKMLDTKEVRVDALGSTGPCNIVYHYDPGCSYTKESFKEVGSLKCTFKSTTRRTIMATGEVMPMTSSTYECIKKYSGVEDDLKIFEALKVKISFKSYDDFLIESKILKGLVLTKKTNFKYGNVSFTYYKKAKGTLNHEEAKNLFGILDVPEVIFDSNIQKKSVNISCTKTIKDWNTGKVYQIPHYECSVSNLQNYSYL